MIKKQSSLLPFLALPAAGALASGAYYWQQNNGEDAGLSKKEKAKRLLRCLVLGGATGLGAATAYTGGKMVWDNMKEASVHKKKVKRASLKRNLLKALIKKAEDPIIPEYSTSMNTNYLLGGGLGLLGGLGLYALLNDEDEKKKGIGGYLSAGLTGLGAGLMGAGAYNQSQYGQLFEEKHPLAGNYYREVDPKSPLVPPTGKRFSTTTVDGKKVYYGPEPGKFSTEDDPDYVAPGSGGTTTVRGNIGWGPVATGVGTVAVLGTAGTGAVKGIGTSRAVSRASTPAEALAADKRLETVRTRPWFRGGQNNFLSLAGRSITKPFRLLSNGAEWLTTWGKELTPEQKALYESLYNTFGNNLRPNKEALHRYLADNYLSSSARSIAKQILNNNTVGFDPTTRNVGATFDPATGAQTTQGNLKFIEPTDITFGDSTFKQQLAAAQNNELFWKAMKEQHPTDPIIALQAANAAAEYKTLIDGKFSYGTVGSSYATSPIKDWKYYTDTDPADLTKLEQQWTNRRIATPEERRKLLRSLIDNKQFLPDDIRSLLSENYIKLSEDIPKLTIAEGKNIEAPNSRYAQEFNKRSNAFIQAREDYEKTVTDPLRNAADREQALKRLSTAYSELQELNKRYSDIPAGRFTRGTTRPAVYTDKLLEGLNPIDTAQLQEKFDWASRGNKAELDAYKKERAAFLKNQADAFLKTYFEGTATPRAEEQLIRKILKEKGNDLPPGIREGLQNKLTWKLLSRTGGSQLTDDIISQKLAERISNRQAEPNFDVDLFKAQLTSEMKALGIPDARINTIWQSTEGILNPTPNPNPLPPTLTPDLYSSVKREYRTWLASNPGGTPEKFLADVSKADWLDNNLPGDALKADARRWLEADFPSAGPSPSPSPAPTKTPITVEEMHNAILAKQKSRPALNVRRAIAYALNKKGYSKPEIQAFLVDYSNYVNSLNNPPNPTPNPNPGNPKAPQPFDIADINYDVVKNQIDTLKSQHTTDVLKKAIEEGVLKRNGTPEQAAQVIAEYERRFGALQGKEVATPNPNPGNVNNEAPSGSKPVTESGTPIDYKSYDYERLQKEVDTLDRAWKNLENARIKGTLNEKGKEALATTKSQLNAARKELRSRPEFKASLNTPLPFGPNKPPKGTEAPKPNKGKELLRELVQPAVDAAGNAGSAETGTPEVKSKANPSEFNTLGPDYWQNLLNGNNTADTPESGASGTAKETDFTKVEPVDLLAKQQQGDAETAKFMEEFRTKYTRQKIDSLKRGLNPEERKELDKALETKDPAKINSVVEKFEVKYPANIKIKSFGDFIKEFKIKK